MRYVGCGGGRPRGVSDPGAGGVRGAAQAITQLSRDRASHFAFGGRRIAGAGRCRRRAASRKPELERVAGSVFCVPKEEGARGRERGVGMRTVAPAKINWTLEVLGRREDGYHEIRSVMQTINLCDELWVSSAPDLLARSVVPENPPPGSVTLRPLPHLFSYAGNESVAGYDGVLGEPVVRALRLLDPEGRKDARIGLTKKIPIAAGLGGGSSDAAATIRVLQRLWALGWERERVAETAAQIGSDVPFFLSGGTALAEGRGERVTPLPDALTAWLVLLVPPIKLPDKTKRMYEAVTAEDFNDGSHSEGLSQRL